MTAEIIDFTTGLPLAWTCAHSSGYRVFADRVECAECGVELDAVSCVRALASRLYAQQRRISALQSDLRRALRARKGGRK